MIMFPILIVDPYLDIPITDRIYLKGATQSSFAPYCTLYGVLESLIKSRRVNVKLETLKIMGQGGQRVKLNIGRVVLICEG